MWSGDSSFLRRDLAKLCFTIVLFGYVWKATGEKKSCPFRTSGEVMRTRTRKMCSIIIFAFMNSVGANYAGERFSDGAANYSLSLI